VIWACAEEGQPSPVPERQKATWLREVRSEVWMELSPDGDPAIPAPSADQAANLQ
jgi:hypothetical protein